MAEPPDRLNAAAAEPARPSLEPVSLADGEHLQAVIPGVEPVSKWARAIEQERRRRAERRGCAPCPDGGLFDTRPPTRQEELF